MDGVESRVQPGHVVVFTPGTRHDLLNDGSEPLNVDTISAPPNHIEGRFHATKAGVDVDVVDEQFGQAVRFMRSAAPCRYAADSIPRSKTWISSIQSRSAYRSRISSITSRR